MLCNKRLDHVKNNDSDGHFKDVFYHIRRWIKEWKGLYCSEITDEMIEDYALERKKVSVDTANNEIRYLRAIFNFGIKKKYISINPANLVDFFPVTKKEAYLPPIEDVYKIISIADPDTQDYLLCIVYTAARVNEINSLEWKYIDFENQEVTLWTRKNRNGDRKSRKVPMAPQLYDLLKNRYDNRELDKPWVFWHTYWSRKSNSWVSGPYHDRKRLMASLCEKADVKYFKFHPFRHFTATILDSLRVPIGVIQRILGHSNRKTTEGYIHSANADERNAMERLGKIEIFSAPIKKGEIHPTNMHPEFWQRKVDRPDYQTLCQDIKNLGFVGTGKKYGVSDNAIRKWKKHYESHFKN
jgi:integrase